MKYFKKTQKNSQGIMAGGLLYNNVTVTRYEDSAVPHDVNAFYRQNLLSTATEKEWKEANVVPKKEEAPAPKVVKEIVTFEEKAKTTTKPAAPTKPAAKTETPKKPTPTPKIEAVTETPAEIVVPQETPAEIVTEKTE